MMTEKNTVSKHDFGKRIRKLSLDEITEAKEVQIKSFMAALQAMHQDIARTACIRYLSLLGYNVVRIN